MARIPDTRPLSIGGLAATGGVSTETICYYQRIGLMETPAREGGTIRRYGQEDVKRLQFIRQAQATGFSLSEIKELVELATCDDRNGIQEMAAARANALDAKILRLQRVRDALRQLADGSESATEATLPIFASVENP